MRSLIDSSIGRLRLNGFAVGISLLVLIFIAIPIQYFGGNPYPVKIIGWIHSILFIHFLYQSYIVKEEQDWPMSFVLNSLLASLLPFGTFIFDKWLKKQMV